MKKKDREIYRAIISEIDWTLCGFCRYSRSDGSVCSGESFTECESPIEAIGEAYNNGDIVSPLDDCWGFNAYVNLRDTADIVGCILSQDFDPHKTQWFKDGDKITVEGVKRTLQEVR